MKLEFRHTELELLYRDRNFFDRRLPENIRKSYVYKCFILEHSETPQDLYKIKSLHYEKYWKHHSVRLNQQRRLVFDIDSLWNVFVVEIIDVNNHYKKNF